MHKNELVKIKLEIDVDPPGNFQTEICHLYSPIPYFVGSYQQPDLFSRKIHALLCRNWKSRIKGRDWFDFMWCISKNIPLYTAHLRERLINSGHLEANEIFENKNVIELFLEKISQLNITLAKEDVLPFINDSAIVARWSREFFEELTRRLTFT